MKTFKKEWTNEDFKNEKKAILKHFRGNLETQHGNHYITSFNQLDNVLGLAYTSTGMYACDGICNTATWLDLEHKFKYEMFVIDQDGIVYAECWDENENAIYIKL